MTWRPAAVHWRIGNHTTACGLTSDHLAMTRFPERATCRRCRAVLARHPEWVKTGENG